MTDGVMLSGRMCGICLLALRSLITGIAVQKGDEGDSRSAIVQMDDECIVAKLLKRLIMVTIHVACPRREWEITQT